MQIARKRPLLLSIVCVIGYLWVIVTFPGIFSPSIKKLGEWYPALYGLIVALSFISFIGVWNMKRWGVNLYVATFFFKQILHVMADDVSKVGISLSTLFIITFIIYYRRMDVNL